LARNKGKTILATIHSPSSEAFYYFDRLILMADGFIVYQGDAKLSIQHFRLINKPVPPFTNPADFFMKILSVRYPKRPEDEALLEDLNRNYRTMLQGSVNAENKIIKLPLPADYEHGAGNARMASTSIQLNWLFFRSWILAKREPRLSRAKILQTVIVALFMMTVFAGLGNLSNIGDINGQGATDSQSLAGAIYFTTVLQMFLNFLPTVIVFQGEKPIFVRERDSGLYHIWIYATTKLLAEMPIMLFVPMLLNVLLYFVVGYDDKFTVFMKFYLTLALMVQAASALGYFLSSVFNHETTAVAFSPIINLPLNLLGGYMIALRGIFQLSPQKYVAWLSYISPVRWGFEGLMLSEYVPVA
jgi:ABC-type multidrug transport system permease subunit